MGYDIETVGFCADYFAAFEVPGSKPGTTYTVTLYGTDGHCTCDGWKFRQDCRHMKQVWAEACLYNPQWHEPGPATLRPTEHLDKPRHYGECPGCKGPMVPVRIAV